MVLTNCNQQNITDLYKEERKAETVITFTNKIADNKILINYTIPMDMIMDSLKIGNSVLHILIDKSDYTLSIIAGTAINKQYPVVLGRNPIDDKLCQGVTALIIELNSAILC